MTFSLHAAAVPAFLQGLNSLSGLADKAIATGRTDADLLDARLAADMKPLSAQFQMASFGPVAAVARLTGTAVPSMPDDETTLAQIKDRIARAIAFVEGVDPSAFEGAETRRVELRFPGVELNFEGAGFLTSFALPNFYFHLTTAYAILRKEGVELGKRDFLGQLDLI